MKFRSLLLPLFLLCAVPAAQAQLTGVAATIPNSMFGTFDLTMSGATNSSPYANGTTVSLTLAIDGSLCSQGLKLRNPFILGGVTTRIYWSDADIGLSFSLDISGAFAGFGVGGADANGPAAAFGTLTGAQTETRDRCDVNSNFFELAEANYPELFPESIFVLTRLTSTSFYRYYSVTGITLSVANGLAYARGGPFLGTVLLGSVESLVASGVDELVVPATEPIVLPSILSGTYRVTFTSAGAFAPIPSGSSFDLALTQEDEICFDGSVMRKPYRDPSNASVVNWGNPSGGFVLQLDVGTSLGTALQFRMLSNEGLLLGTLGGTRTQLLANCAGVVGGNIDIAAANALFTLAEQIYPNLFPPSVLSFNQFNGTSLLRYYPATGVLVTVTGADVSVSGGAYGSAQRKMGTIASLSQTLKSKTPGFIPYKVRVNGNVTIDMGNLPTLNQKIELDKAPIPLPTKTDTATLATHVQEVLGEELRGTSTFVFSNIVSSTNSLQFDVSIQNQRTIATTRVTRAYTLRFVYSK